MLSSKFILSDAPHSWNAEIKTPCSNSSEGGPATSPPHPPYFHAAPSCCLSEVVCCDGGGLLVCMRTPLFGVACSLWGWANTLTLKFAIIAYLGQVRGTFAPLLIRTSLYSVHSPLLLFWEIKPPPACSLLNIRRMCVHHQGT